MSTVAYGLDLASAAATGGAVLYCAVLSRRLSRLHRLKGGVGAAIAELGAATKRSAAEAAAIEHAATQAVGTLNAAFAEVEAKRREVMDLIDVMDGQTGGMERRAREAREAAEASLLATTGRARIELAALSDALGIAHETGRALGAAPKDEPVVADDVASVVTPTLKTARAAVQRPASRPNPFLRVAS